VLMLILALSILASFRKGFSRELIGLIAVVAAVLAGMGFYGTAGGVLMPYFSSRGLANFLGFLLVFCLVLLLGALVSFVAGKFLKVTGLSFVDHLLGAGFGLLRGILIGVALIMGIMAFSPSQGPPASVVNSRTAPYLVDAARVLAAVAPHELKDGYRKTYGEVQEAWKKALRNGIRTAPGPEIRQ